MTDKPRMPHALLDDLAAMASNAAGLAQGAKQEMETLLRARMERWLASRDFITREEFESVREMAARAREENEILSKRLAKLEAKSSPAQKS